MRETERMTETSEGREPSLREASATDAGECNWAASIAPDALLAAGGDILERPYHANRALFEFWRTDRVLRGCEPAHRRVPYHRGRAADPGPLCPGHAARVRRDVEQTARPALHRGRGVRACEGARRIDARRLILARGAAGKTPIVAAVETTAECRPKRLRLSVVKGFRKKEVERLAERDFAAGSDVVSDGTAGSNPGLRRRLATSRL